jgi:rSAM/selenodomain-associated transferase 2
MPAPRGGVPQRSPSGPTRPLAELPPGPPPLSVVVPVLDEAQRLPALLAQLQQASELVAEVLVVDGGSRDASRTIAALAGAQLLRQSGGRGRQLAAGVAAARSSWLLLLHGDCSLPQGWERALGRAIRRRQPRAPLGDGAAAQAYYFELAIGGRQLGLRLVELAVGLRSRWGQRPYGDQGLLLPAALLAAAGGVRPIPLMEDLDLVQRLRGHGRLVSLGLRLRVDGRRWRRLGVWGATLANARLRRAWRRGVAPEELARRYRGP